jgi:SpoVK/Ycf46/Vps4 family AAA+-type ATPase
MINSVDQKIHALIQSPHFYEREVKSRITSIVVTALVPIEAAGRVIFAALKVTTYVVSEPFKLGKRVIRLYNDPTYYRSQFAQEELASLKNTLIPVAKAISCIACIKLALLLGLWSPRAMIQLHVDMGLATLPKEDLAPPPPPKLQEKKPPLNSDVQKNIDDNFLAAYTSKEEREKLKKYSLTPPRSILLYGPSMAANMQGAEYIASRLGKTVKELNFNDPKALENFNPLHDLIYLNVKKNGQQNSKLITSALDKLGVLYIFAAKDKEAVLAPVKVEVPLPDQVLREEMLHQSFDSAPKADTLDFARLVQATNGLKAKTIQQLLRETKRRAFQTNSLITTELALEILSRGKKPKARVEPPKAAADFVGMEELLEKFDLYLDVLKNPQEAKEYGVNLPAGMILYGAPGCGKTYTAKHLCEYAKSKGIALNFYAIKGSDVASKWKGEGVKKIRQAFEEAKLLAPVVLFIDECEGLFPSRDKLKDTLSTERTQELDEVLQLIEEAKNHNIIVIGATNHISSIDEAILRTGRFDYTYEVKPPNESTRRKMIEAKLKLRKWDPRINLDVVAKASEGFTGSDIDTAVNDAGLVSWKQKKPIDQQILLKSLEAVKGKKASVAHEPSSSEPAPVLQDLKKGMDALRHFIGNLDSMNPQAAQANDLH